MLIVGKSNIQKTHYDILSVKEDADFDEIRAGYRSAILNSHPDKLQRVIGTSGQPQNLQEKFLNIQKAWEVLGDSKSRELYDHELKASRHDTETADDIGLEEMSLEDAGDVLELFYQCRCGDYFVIDSAELEDMGYTLDKGGYKNLVKRPEAVLSSVILPCGSCSLKIRLTIDSHC
ncbi:hypothetical protein IFM89_001142 [Coptis chinensis]|uniref:DPH4 homolog n=1 Tax=Coptis chinensis TaxID=261450 RepID=A0A835IJP0_9MAGN|nr:hypothetical protein IFM89_001142 [Coptis chinensis]